MSISRKDFLKLSSITALGGITTGNSNRNTSESAPDLIKAERLKEGATLGLVAPASPVYDSTQFDEMLVTLRSLGYNLKLGKHVRDRNGYLAGKDEDRAKDLMEMFADDTVDGILCVRGGWGCNRILPLLDFEIIKQNPKVFAGFSDITSLHMAILKKTGLVTFHGPVGKSEWNTFTLNAWNKVIRDGIEFTYEIPDDDVNNFTITKGKATGTLVGGNLSVLVSLIGSDYLPDLKDSILYLEDVGEDVYRIDRMITQLKLSGVLDQINGFVFGKCTDCDSGSNSLSLKEVFADHISLLDIPAFYGAMISHEDKNITLPVGVQAGINAEEKTIHLLESGVN